MFDYIRGTLIEKNAGQAVLEANGIGYKLNISLQTYTALDGLEKCKLFIHYHVNGQDYIPTLFGFISKQERGVFEQLISVQGIGTNTARIILSSLKPEELALAIEQERVEVFKSVKGVGPKTAKRVILDLKGKLSEFLPQDGTLEIASTSPKDHPARSAALQALIALGFNKVASQRALNHVIKQNPTLKQDGELVRAALSELRK